MPDLFLHNFKHCCATQLPYTLILVQLQYIFNPNNTQVTKNEAGGNLPFMVSAGNVAG